LSKLFFTSLPHPWADNCERASDGVHLPEQVGCTRALSQLHAQIVNNRADNCTRSQSHLQMSSILTHFFALQLIFIVFLSSLHLFKLYENIGLCMISRYVYIFIKLSFRMNFLIIFIFYAETKLFIAHERFMKMNFPAWNLTYMHLNGSYA
jgi:hypothetical protein